MEFFTRKKKEDSKEIKKNWYVDRYQTLIVQRNFVALLLILSIIGIIVLSIAFIKVVKMRKIEPFVIEIEEKTGITNVIRPIQQEKYAYDETLRRAFLYQYMNKRESYDPVSFEYNYFTIVRLLSDSSVYANFKREVNANNPNSPVRLGQEKRIIKIKSIIFPNPVAGQRDFLAQIHFLLEDSSGSRHKVATVNFVFADLVLSQEERSINPLGFQVTGYRVDDEILQ